MARVTKQSVYKQYGIVYDPKTGKLESPIGPVAELLKCGNSKIGKVWQLSTLPTNGLVHTKGYGDVCGTCPCHCAGCYGTKGCYNFYSVRDAIARNTILVRDWMTWARSALMAQLDYITKDNTKPARVRWHVTGDMFSLDYALMLRDICNAYTVARFWTYTKSEFGHVFDDVANCNVVNSMIIGVGYNFGHIDYVLDTYCHLVDMGETPWLCPCGTRDDGTKCDACDGCILHKYVLFGEHSTEYDITADPLYGLYTDIVRMQATHTAREVAAYIRAL